MYLFLMYIFLQNLVLFQGKTITREIYNIIYGRSTLFKLKPRRLLHVAPPHLKAFKLHKRILCTFSPLACQYLFIS